LLRPGCLTARKAYANGCTLDSNVIGGKLHPQFVHGQLDEYSLDQAAKGFLGIALGASRGNQHDPALHASECRLDLAAKGRRPDLLVMTATPIPRTLVLALYGDMAVSELRAKPPGRQAIRTRALPLARLDRILAAVARALGQGEQLYWVCPPLGNGASARTRVD
jgi:hypothetical protein